LYWVAKGTRITAAWCHVVVTTMSSTKWCKSLLSAELEDEESVCLWIIKIVPHLGRNTSPLAKVLLQNLAWLCVHYLEGLFHKFHCFVVSNSCHGHFRAENLSVSLWALKTSSVIFFPKPSTISDNVVTCE
jgi:hypothetical protein